MIQRVGHIPFEVGGGERFLAVSFRETFRDGSWGLFYLPRASGGLNFHQKDPGRACAPWFFFFSTFENKKQKN
jgi:hypothetical protein